MDSHTPLDHATLHLSISSSSVINYRNASPGRRQHGNVIDLLVRMRFDGDLCNFCVRATSGLARSIRNLKSFGSTIRPTMAYNAACESETMQDVDSSSGTAMLWCSYLEGESETHKSYGI